MVPLRREGQRHFPSTCARLHAHTHQLTCRGTDRPVGSTDIHADVGAHTETCDVIPLPDSEEEPRMQTLAPRQHRHRHMRTHFSWGGRAKDEREES